MNTNTPPETPSQGSPPTEERLAKLTGFNNPSAQPDDASNLSTSSSTPSSLLSDEDLEEQITRHSFASSPLSKLVFVAGAVFFVVFIASLFLSQFQSPGESVSAKKATEIKQNQQSPLLSPENQDKEKGELLSELALREQQERLKDLDDQKTKHKRLETVAKQEKPAVRAVAVRPAPVRQVIRQPLPRTLPVRYSQPIHPLLVVRPTRIGSLQSQSSPADPTQLWAQLAQVGSFGGGQVSTRSSGNPERLAPRYDPKTAPITVAVQKSQPLATPSSEPYPLTGNSDRAITFGQSVSAVLETAIAWEGSRTSRTTQTSDDRYIVTLRKPLKDKFGNLEIPAGSQVIIRLEGSNTALVTLVAESIIVNGVETKLPLGALKIRGAKDQPLIAEMMTLGGNDGNDNTQTLTDFLSVAGDFANIPGSRSLSSLSRLLTGGNNRRSSSGITATVFFLREGTPLEVFVNKAFSLDIPQPPLKLDLSAIELPSRPLALKSTNEVGEN